MLKALYDYGIRNKLTLPPGFIKKQIKGYISLSGSGSFLDIELCGNEIQPCPDIGSMANSKDKCNALAEKLSVILFLPENEGEISAKNAFRKDSVRCLVVNSLPVSNSSILIIRRERKQIRKCPSKLFLDQTNTGLILRKDFIVQPSVDNAVLYTTIIVLFFGTKTPLWS